MKQSKNQLFLLLWKHFILQKRSIPGLLLKLIVPALFAIILMPVRTVIKSDLNPEETTYKPFDLEKFSNEIIIYRNSSFAYWPNTSDLVNRIMKRVSNSIELDYTCMHAYHFFLLLNYI